MEVRGCDQWHVGLGVALSRVDVDKTLVAVVSGREKLVRSEDTAASMIRMVHVVLRQSLLLLRWQ